jgi:hypothetical protein
MNERDAAPTPGPPAGDPQWRGTAGDEGGPALGDLTSLLLGGALEGSEALGRRLHRWHDAIRSRRYDAPDDETLADVLRYALLGMLLEGERAVRWQLATLWRLSDDAAWLLSAALRPAARTWPGRRMRRLLDARLDRWQDDMDRWIRMGRREELFGRQLARQAAADEVEELLALLAHHPAVRALIERQGEEMAESAVEDARFRAASADDWVERVAHRLLHRSPADRAGPPGPPARAAARPGRDG